jgi:regulator of protease activity HflC (stomatin/prohibitin superfamily)
VTQFLQFLTDLLKNLPPFVIVQPDEVGVLVRCGKLKRTLKGGFYWRIPILDSVRTVPSTEQTIDLANQTVESADGVSYTLSGYLKYTVVDAAKAILTVHDYDVSLPRQALYEIANAVGMTHSPKQCEIAEVVAESMDQYAEQWGIEILEFGLCEFTKAVVLRLMQQGG